MSLACLIAAAALGEGVFQKAKQGVPWATLSAEQASRLDGGEWSTLRSRDVPKLSDAIFAGLVADDFAKWKSCCSGISELQLGLIPPLAISNMNPVCLKSLSPTQFAWLSPEQLSHVPAQIAQFVTRRQIASLLGTTCREMSANSLAKYLTPSACRGLSADCTSATPTEVFASMSPDCVQHIGPAGIGAMEPGALEAVFLQLLPHQVGWLTRDQCQMVSPVTLLGVAPGCAGFTPQCITALPTATLGGLPAGCAEHISIPALHVLSEGPSLLPYMAAGLPSLIAGSWVRMEALGPGVCAVILPSDAALLPNALCRALSPGCAHSFTPAVLEAVPAGCIAAMSLQTLAAIPTRLMPLVNAQAFAQFSDMQLGALTPFQCAQLQTSQVSAILPPLSCSNTARRCVQFSSPASAGQLRDPCPQEPSV